MAAPKTKFEHKIVELSRELPGLTEDQVEYLKEEIFDHQATLLKSGKLSCLDCGHQWQKSEEADIATVILGVECPSCHRQLRVDQTRKKVFAYSRYYQVIDTYKGHQVIRMFEARKYFKAGQPQHFTYSKIYENWFDKNGQTRTVGQYLTSKWNECWGGSYELRSNRSATYYDSKVNEKLIYPKKKFISTLKRNGLRTSLHDINPFHLFRRLLTDSKTETLFKAKQYDVIRSGMDIEKYWPSIRICLRNNYIIKDASIWRDYIGYLEYFGKDLRNPEYVCPSNLREAHDIYMAKHQRHRNRLEYERKKQQAKEDEENYRKEKAPYMELSFSKGNLKICFIKSVKQLAEESERLHHCAFSNNYHRNENNLMFSVRKNGNVIATAQVRKSSGELAQLRGLQNCIIKEDEEVRELFEENMSKIINPKPKKRKKKKREMAMAS